jgi:N-acetylated-alpha-linked acidic dipeptidase
VEDHADELQKKAVVYINTDGNGRGFLGIEGSHALEPLASEVARDVTDPEMNISVLDRTKSVDVIRAATVKAKQEVIDRKGLAMGALGSGSDYSPFIQHLGIPSFNLGYGGEDPGGEYHSIYDSYDDYRRFKDPGFVYGVALAKTAGRLTLRMADAELLPFDFRSLYKTINGYATDLINLSQEMRETTRIENQLIRDQQYKYAGDPTQHLTAPELKEEVPFLNFSSLQNALTSLDKTTSALSDALAKSKPTGQKLDQVNTELFRAEQQLLSDKGLPRRPWYKHTIYAPGYYTGYGVKTLPGIREALEQRNWKEALEQIEIAAASIGKLNTYLQATISTLR